MSRIKPEAEVWRGFAQHEMAFLSAKRFGHGDIEGRTDAAFGMVVCGVVPGIAQPHGTRLVVITRDLGEDAIRASWQEFITKMESA